MKIRHWPPRVARSVGFPSLGWSDLFMRAEARPSPSVSLGSLGAGALVALPASSSELRRASPATEGLVCAPDGQARVPSLTSSLCGGTARSPASQGGLCPGDQACWPDGVVRFALFSRETSGGLIEASVPLRACQGAAGGPVAQPFLACSR